MKEHDYTFEATIETTVGAYFEEEEYQDFAEEGESREEYARRRAMEDAPRRLTMRIADDGIAASAIELGEVEYHDEWEP